MKNILRFIFNRYKSTFEEFLVEDFIGQIPKSLNEPAIEFLAQGRQKLEPWILYTSYYTQRRAVAEIHNAQIYHGVLLILKVLSSIVSTKPISVESPIQISDDQKDRDPMAGVQEFVTGMREFATKKI